MLVRGWIVMALLLAASAPLASAAQQPDERRLRRAWTYLLPEEQDDVLARFEGEAPTLPGLQSRLIRFVLSESELDWSAFPREAETAFYDPLVHAPAQPIARRRLEPDSAQAEREVERVFAKFPRRKLRPGWRYDWGARQILRTVASDDRERRFDNALAGYAPNLDLAEALVERALDGGEHQRVLAAFGHAYTDREGHVFPGITLYDAWASGVEMEMPDVDVLGLLHDIEGPTTRWVAPVPGSEHDALYEHVGGLFRPAHGYRALRVALARTFLCGSVELRDGYEAHRDRLHALWSAFQSTPRELAPRLPDSDGLALFLEKWTLECEESEKLRDGGIQRRAALDLEQQRLRELLVQILSESGALERSARPSPREAKAK